MEQNISFSREVKEELSRQMSGGRHCGIAEMTAIISLCGHVKISGQNRFSVKITTEYSCGEKVLHITEKNI